MTASPTDRLVLIVDDAAPEPLVAPLQAALGPDSVAIWPLSHLLSDAGIHFADGQATDTAFRLTDDGLAIGCVLDRVVEISPTTIREIDPSGLTSIGQVSDAYQALLAVQTGAPRHGLYSTVGDIVPLFTQWARIGGRFPGIDVPDFVNGYGPEPVADDAVPDAIHKSPFDLYSWQPNTRARELDVDRFAVSRPKGRPILSYVVGDHVRAVALGGDETDVGDALSDITRAIAAVFGTRIGEILWFHDAATGRSTFAAFSHQLFAAARTKSLTQDAAAILRELRALASDWTPVAVAA